MSNLPDDFDQREFDRFYGSSYTRCEDCDHYRRISDGKQSVELCLFDDVDFIPDEGGCELC